MDRRDDVRRIEEALRAAAEAIRPYTPGQVGFVTKEERDDPLTLADLTADRLLRARLPREGEGWLSEESADDRSRLACRRVWVVDPIDGTREFVEGIPEWCISIGLLEDGVPVAGGVFNPVSEELVVGSQETGVVYNGEPAMILDPPTLDMVTVLASRSEIKRGEWDRFDDAPFAVEPCGSVAYKMGLVAGGRAAATFTVVPKSEWDVAAGAALVRAAGGRVSFLDGAEPAFNQEDPVFPNLVAAGPRTWRGLTEDWLGVPA